MGTIILCNNIVYNNVLFRVHYLFFCLTCPHRNLTIATALDRRADLFIVNQNDRKIMKSYQTL